MATMIHGVAITVSAAAASAESRPRVTMTARQFATSSMVLLPGWSTMLLNNNHRMNPSFYPAAPGAAAAGVAVTPGSYRFKHSSTQIKRLFKKNPARRRLEQKQVLQQQPGGSVNDSNVVITGMMIPEAQFPPVVTNVTFLPNGWNPPPSPEERNNIPTYPFQVSRTKQKPNDAVGFLPVYSEFR
jgi:hypothetical protein